MILKALLHCALFHFFTGVLDTNMLVSKTPVKKREKSEKDTRKLAKAKRESVAFFTRLKLTKRKPNA